MTGNTPLPSHVFTNFGITLVINAPKDIQVHNSRQYNEEEFDTVMSLIQGPLSKMGVPWKGELGDGNVCTISAIGDFEAFKAAVLEVCSKRDEQVVSRPGLVAELVDRRKHPEKWAAFDKEQQEQTAAQMAADAAAAKEQMRGEIGRILQKGIEGKDGDKNPDKKNDWYRWN